jgi:putative transposase
MPRSLRVFIPDVSVHAIQRAVNRSAMFHQRDDYEYFLEILAFIAHDCAVSVHGFVLMTTHFHLLVTPGHKDSLPHAMQRIGIRYAQYFNRKYGRTGPICNARYRGILLEDERHWLTCLRYIEQNPVRAHMVRLPSEYEWSTYGVHARGDVCSWLTEHQLYARLGSTAPARRAAYQAICALPLDNAEVTLQRRPPTRSTRHFAETNQTSALIGGPDR